MRLLHSGKLIARWPAVLLAAAFILGGANASAASPKAAQVFKADGTVASASLGLQVINGIPYAVSVSVVVDNDSGLTRLMLRGRTLYAGGSRTDVILWGTIPAADFSVASDLSSASLTTLIATTPTDFNNADVGPIAGLAINLTWSAFATGKVTQTYIFDSRTVGSPQASTRDVFHANGPMSECTVNGMFDAAPVTNASGAVERDGSIEIIQSK